jgi:hypothetical protein
MPRSSSRLTFRPGSDFVHEMQRAAADAGRTIAVLSPVMTLPEIPHFC